MFGLVRPGAGGTGPSGRKDIVTVPIHLHRSNRVEALVDALGSALAASWPADPFERVPIVVGSRGMERWLRYELATALGVASRLDFPFPRPAFDGAARWILSGGGDARTPFWDPKVYGRTAPAWRGDALCPAIVGPLRRRLEEDAFAAVAQYLGTGRAPPRGDAPLGPREFSFAREVASVLDRLMHDRPALALEWALHPERSPESHQWLARLLADLGVASDPESPARMHRDLQEATLPAVDRQLFVFGLSTLGPGERFRLGGLARALDIHLFLLVPSDRWWSDVRTKGELRKAWAAVESEEERQRIEAEVQSENPVLSQLGLPSRDLQWWLEDLSYTDDVVGSEDPSESEGGGEPSVLERVQGWVLRAEGDAEVELPWNRDSSFAGNAAFGALRQCEVLRDQLLTLFAEDPSLEPRDVLVMTPDIQTYAPLVSAVFARRGSGLPPIPTEIGDLGLRQTNAVAHVLLELLSLVGDRISASRVLDLVASEPVRRRFGLDAEDVADLRGLLASSGARWGLDAADRAEVGQPALDQNTFRFALERLALGVLMPDEDALAVVPGESSALKSAVPLPIETRERVRRVGALIAVLRGLGAFRRRLKGPHPLPVWREHLRQAVQAFCSVASQAQWLVSELDEELDEWVESWEPLDGLSVERETVLRALEGRFEHAQRGDRPLSGAVTLCALEPMRSVPFRVVVLLGMDDGAFPRGRPRRTWDPLSEAQAGERDRRAIDRHLLLEALLSARDRFWLYWSGVDMQRAEQRAACVPVEELLDVVGKLCGVSRDDLVQRHPLQPWSPEAVATGPRLDRQLVEAARLRQDMRRGEREPEALGLSASSGGSLPPEEQPPTVLKIEDLLDGLVHPLRMFLKSRLGVRFAPGEEAVLDREPLELEALSTWGLRDRLLGPRGLVGEETPLDSLQDALTARLAGEGLLPPSAAGTERVRQVCEQAQAGLQIRGWAAGSPAPPLDLGFDLPSGLQLQGHVDKVRELRGRLLLDFPSSSKTANDRSQLQAWLHLLLALASGLPVDGARCTGVGDRLGAGSAAGRLLRFEGAAEDARDQLEDLVEVWRKGRCEPLPLFAKSSPALATALRSQGAAAEDGENRVAFFRAVYPSWQGSKRGGSFSIKGDRDDANVRCFFPDFELSTALQSSGPWSLRGLARRVWLPLRDGCVAGETLRGRWAPPSEDEPR